MFNFCTYYMKGVGFFQDFYHIKIRIEQAIEKSQYVSYGSKDCHRFGNVCPSLRITFTIIKLCLGRQTSIPSKVERNFQF